MIQIVFAFVAFTSFGHSLDEKLRSNQVIRFEFADLPDTLATMESGRREPARLTAQLPENYSAEGAFPVFVFLTGGAGGRGDSLFLDRFQTIGARDFIMVNLPLFKAACHPANNIGITVDDFQTVSRAWRAMLQKLFATVTNTTAERSAIGGFSNGAHTIALLVAGQDEFVLRHFRAFYFVEGGYSLVVNVLHKPSLRRCRFLLIRGDYQGAPQHGYDHVFRAIESIAADAKLDFTSILMRDVGHTFPSRYQEMLGKWVRGEDIREERPHGN